MIDGDEIGSCFAIQQHSEIPTKFLPKIKLKVNIVNSLSAKSVLAGENS
jgi:hypothetical protein